MRFRAAAVPALALGVEVGSGHLVMSPLRVAVAGAEQLLMPRFGQGNALLLSHQSRFSAFTHAGLFRAVQASPNILNRSRCFSKHTHAWLCRRLQLLRASVGSRPAKELLENRPRGDREGDETLSNLFGFRLPPVICETCKRLAGGKVGKSSVCLFLFFFLKDLQRFRLHNHLANCLIHEPVSPGLRAVETGEGFFRFLLFLFYFIFSLNFVFILLMPYYLLSLSLSVGERRALCLGWNGLSAFPAPEVPYPRGCCAGNSRELRAALHLPAARQSGSRDLKAEGRHGEERNSTYLQILACRSPS